MADAMVPLATTTLSTTASTVLFGIFPSTYRDLRIVVSFAATTDGNLGIYVNGDTASNYSQVNMRGYATSSIASSTSTGGAINSNYNTGSGTGWVTNTFDLLDYSQTNKHKTILIRANHAGEIDAIVGRWASTSAITSIVLTSGNTFAVGSTFSLYGIVG